MTTLSTVLLLVGLGLLLLAFVLGVLWQAPSLLQLVNASKGRVRSGTPKVHKHNSTIPAPENYIPDRDRSTGLLNNKTTGLLNNKTTGLLSNKQTGNLTVEENSIKEITPRVQTAREVKPGGSTPKYGGLVFMEGIISQDKDSELKLSNIPELQVIIKSNETNLSRQTTLGVEDSDLLDLDKCDLVDNEAQVVEEDATELLVVDDATELLVVEDATELLVVEDATELLVVEDATELLVVDDATELLVVEDATELLVVDDATELLVVEDDATELLVVDDATELLVVEDNATELLVVEDDATELLVVEDATELLVVEDNATELLVVEDNATELLVVEDDATELLVVEANSK